MTEAEIKAELKEINDDLKGYSAIIKTIDDLKSRKTKLTKKLDKLKTADLPFEKQFLKWLKAGNKGKKEIYIPDDDIYPNLRLLMEGDDDNWDRHRTYEIKEDWPFIEWWDKITDEDGIAKAEKDGLDYDVIVLAAKEVMKNNLVSFKFDW